MTAPELIADLRMMGPQDLRVIFNYLADHAMEARLAEGQRICDVTDVRAWLRELAEAAKVSGYPESTKVSPATEFRTWAKVTQPQPRWKTCPRCGHVHQKEKECGVFMGGGGFCLCELEVPA